MLQFSQVPELCFFELRGFLCISIQEYTFINNMLKYGVLYYDIFYGTHTYVRNLVYLEISFHTIFIISHHFLELTVH
jgi:hypothetical protein